MKILPPTSPKTLEEMWLEIWPKALINWSRFTRLSTPTFCQTSEDAAKLGLTDSFAMIRLVDHLIVVDLEKIKALHLENYGLEILSHEIGHHILCPASLDDHARMLIRVDKALADQKSQSAMVANLYADLIINDHLQRMVGTHMEEVYKKLPAASDLLWQFYMRTYELLWSLPRQTLSKGPENLSLEEDARWACRLVRVYSQEPIDGAGGFATLVYPYLEKNLSSSLKQVLKTLADLKDALKGGELGNLAATEEGEEPVHPALDPKLAGDGETLGKDRGDIKGKKAMDTTSVAGNSKGQYREPFEYGEILRALGLDLNDHQAAVRYYRERSLSHLIPFPVRHQPQAKEEVVPEGLENWDIGEPLERIDWFQSLLFSPKPIPGYSTVKRIYGLEEGSLPEKAPVDLDLYIDSSGSMPNCQKDTSYLALAGTIVALSALRAGGRVRATLWSGTHQFQTTKEFLTEESKILQIITGYIGGSTAFPIHLLREGFPVKSIRPVHILVISDDGVTTMFSQDERGQSGREISTRALLNAGGGGTMVLNLPRAISGDPELVRAQKDGWEIHRVTKWEELVTFAQEFSRRRFQ